MKRILISLLLVLLILPITFAANFCGVNFGTEKNAVVDSTGNPVIKVDDNGNVLFNSTSFTKNNGNIPDPTLPGYFIVKVGGVIRAMFSSASSYVYGSLTNNTNIVSPQNKFVINFGSTSILSIDGSGDLVTKGYALFENGKARCADDGYTCSSSFLQWINYTCRVRDGGCPSFQYNSTDCGTSGYGSNYCSPSGSGGSVVKDYHERACNAIGGKCDDAVTSTAVVNGCGSDSGGLQCSGNKLHLSGQHSGCSGASCYGPNSYDIIQSDCCNGNAGCGTGATTPKCNLAANDGNINKENGCPDGQVQCSSTVVTDCHSCSDTSSGNGYVAGTVSGLGGCSTGSTSCNSYSTPDRCDDSNTKTDFYCQSSSSQTAQSLSCQTCSGWSAQQNNRASTTSGYSGCNSGTGGCNPYSHTSFCSGSTLSTYYCSSQVEQTATYDCTNEKSCSSDGQDATTNAGTCCSTTGQSSPFCSNSDPSSCSNTVTLNHYCTDDHTLRKYGCSGSQWNNVDTSCPTADYWGNKRCDGSNHVIQSHYHTCTGGACGSGTEDSSHTRIYDDCGSYRPAKLCQGSSGSAFCGGL